MTKPIIDTAELLGFRLAEDGRDLTVRAGAKVGNGKQLPPQPPSPPPQPR